MFWFLAIALCCVGAYFLRRRIHSISLSKVAGVARPRRVHGNPKSGYLT